MGGRTDLHGQSCAAIGGGIGGMALAMRAAALGRRVTPIEADPDWRVAGAGISITGPTCRALKRLGVLEEVWADGFFIAAAARLCTADGRTVGEVPMAPIEPGPRTAGGIMRLLDDGETVVRAGDIVVRRGTDHGRANNTDRPWRIASVLADGVRDGLG